MFKTSFILSILIILTSIGSVFAVSNAFTDVYLLPKWFCLFIGISSMLAYCGGKLTMQRECFYLNVHILYQCFVGICIIQALLGIVQYLGLFGTLRNFPVVGSFDNPAGFVCCICAGIPLGYLFFKLKNPYHWLGLGIVFLAILLSNSRTGLISFFLIGIILFLQQSKINIKWKILLIIFFILFCFGLITLYKTDSANGRMLIWKCSWEMIKENPFLGHGIGSFKANYMDYQATYFRTFSTSEYAMLADNINHPFNEYILLLVQFGLTGMITLILFVVFLIICYQRNPTTLGKSALLSLLAIGTCSLFSYPLKYPFVWFILVWDCIIIVYYSRSKWNIPSFIKILTGISFLIFSIIISYRIITQIQMESQWKNNLTTYQSSDKKLEKYECLLEGFHDNPYFLYNYSTELYYSKQYRKSLEMAFRCKEYWSDYDLEMLIGENYRQQHEYSKAIKHFETASFMCPVKFTPLYRIFQIYKHSDASQELCHIAKRIIYKPIKVESPFITRIKKEAEDIINRK